MIQLALDPFMLRTTPLTALPARVKKLGYSRIELSPRGDFLPLFVHPRASSIEVRDFKVAARSEAVEIASLMVVYRWASQDADERDAAVRYWKRAIEICVDLGCTAINSELGGTPEAPEASEQAFWRSLEVVLPLLESEGIRLRLEPHPGDFIEDGLGAVRLVKSIDSPLVDFTYCSPHTFHMGGNVEEIVRAAGPALRHVHLADSLDHTASSGLKFIVNPLGSTVRVHQHSAFGRGDVDFQRLFDALAATSFEGLMTVCIFDCEESADTTLIECLSQVQQYISQAGLQCSV